MSMRSGPKDYEILETPAYRVLVPEEFRRSLGLLEGAMSEAAIVEAYRVHLSERERERRKQESKKLRQMLGGSPTRRQHGRSR
jgi:bifunctional DNA-binding transcriptional regulator/antitoxin component of YhaV-PrlF toxin-antitoxin module